MSDFEAEMQRLADLVMAVRNYLSHLAAFEQGADVDPGPLEHWRDQLDLLTSGEPACETLGMHR